MLTKPIVIIFQYLHVSNNHMHTLSLNNIIYQSCHNKARKNALQITVSQ